MSEIFGHKLIKTGRGAVPKLQVLAVQDRNSDFIIAKKPLFSFPLPSEFLSLSALRSDFGFFLLRKFHSQRSESKLGL